ncbi:Hypothetical protein A7982_02692 [Minicystis rosea]|nr:Hypothetical protein A7982_02692 [Minicystis rosea]
MPKNKGKKKDERLGGPGTLFDHDDSFSLSEGNSLKIGEKGLCEAEDQGAREAHDVLDLGMIVDTDMQREGTTDEMSTLAEPPLSVGVATWNAQRFGYPDTPVQWEDRRHVVHCVHWMFEANPWLDFIVAQELSNLDGFVAVYNDVTSTLGELSFDLLDAGPFLFTLTVEGKVAAPEWYPIFVRRGSGWKVAAVYVHARLEDGTVVIHRCDERGKTNKAFWWEKQRGVFRPVVVYHVVHEETRHQLKIGVVHTTPDGQELNRPEDFEQILPVVEYMAEHEEDRWVLTGDFYLPPEAVVSSIAARAAPLLDAYEEQYGERARLLLPPSIDHLRIDQLTRLLCDEEARLLAYLDTGPDLSLKRPSRYRSYVLSAMEYHACDDALRVLVAWLSASGFPEDEHAADDLIGALRLLQENDRECIRSLMRLFQDERHTSERTGWSEGRWGAHALVVGDNIPFFVDGALLLLMTFVERIFTQFFEAPELALAWAMGDWNTHEVSDFCICFAAALPGDDHPLPARAQRQWVLEREEMLSDRERWYARHVVMVRDRLNEYMRRPQPTSTTSGKKRGRSNSTGAGYGDEPLGRSDETREQLKEIGTQRVEPRWYATAREPDVPSIPETNKAMDEIEGRAPDKVFFKAKPRTVQKKKQRFNKSKSKEERASSGDDPRKYPIAPEPDERRFRNVFGLTFEKQLQARSLDVLAPVSSTNLKSHFSIRFGMHWSSRLADFAVIRPTQWKVKLAGLMSPELYPGTGGLVPVDSEGHWALWCWLHLSDHAPSGVFLSTSGRQQKTADQIVDGLGRALALVGGVSEVSERELEHRSQNRERGFNRMIALYGPCLQAYREAFVSKLPRTEQALGYLHTLVVRAIWGTLEPKEDPPPLEDLLELGDVEALAGFFYAHWPEMMKALYGGDVPYRERVALMIILCREGIEQRMGAYGFATRNEGEQRPVVEGALAVLVMVHKRLCSRVLDGDYVEEEEVDAVIEEEAERVGLPPTRDMVFAYADGWLETAVDFLSNAMFDEGDDALLVHIHLAEMRFMFALARWLLDELPGHGGEEVGEEHFSDDKIASTYPDARPLRGPGRYVGKDGGGKDKGKGPQRLDGPPRDRTDREPRDRRDDDRRGPPPSSKPPGNQGGTSQRGGTKSISKNTTNDLGGSMLLSPYSHLELQPKQTITSTQKASKVPKERVLQLDESWINVLDSVKIATQMQGLGNTLKRRREKITVASIACARQPHRDACGICALINGRTLLDLHEGLAMSALDRMVATLKNVQPAYDDVEWEGLKTQMEISKGLFFSHVEGRLHGGLVIPPFTDDGATLEYSEDAFTTFIQRIKALHTQNGSIVMVAGSQAENHWRAVVIHRYVWVIPQWEILIADSQYNEVLVQAFGQDLARWIDAPDEMLALSQEDERGNATSKYGISVT